MKYTCNDCVLTPCCYKLIPVNISDINLFKLKNIDITYYFYRLKGSTNNFLAYIMPIDNHCPLLKNGLCSEYIIRPDYCRGHQCKALLKDKSIIENLDKNNKIEDYFNLHLNSIDNDFYFKHIPIELDKLPIGVKYKYINYEKLCKLTNDKTIINNILNRIGR